MQCEEKVANGKLVCFDVECKEGRTQSVKLTGDFFLHPEDAIEWVESSLSGIETDISDKELVSLISEALQGAELIGATPEDLARIFRRAANK